MPDNLNVCEIVAENAVLRTLWGIFVLRMHIRGRMILPVSDPTTPVDPAWSKTCLWSLAQSAILLYFQPYFYCACAETAKNITTLIRAQCCYLTKTSWKHGRSLMYESKREWLWNRSCECVIGSYMFIWRHLRNSPAPIYRGQLQAWTTRFATWEAVLGPQRSFSFSQTRTSQGLSTRRPHSYMTLQHIPQPLS